MKLFYSCHGGTHTRDRESSTDPDPGTRFEDFINVIEVSTQIFGVRGPKWLFLKYTYLLWDA